MPEDLNKREEDLSTDELQQLLTHLIGKMNSSDSAKKAAPTLSTENIETLYAMAHQMYTRKNYDQASDLFRVLTVVDMANRRNWVALGAALQMLKKYEEAVEMYGVAAVMEPSDPYIHFHASECFFSLGDKEKGLIALASAELTATNQEKKDKSLISRLALFRQSWCNETSITKDRLL